MSLSRYKLVFFSPRNKTSAILDALFQKYPQELGKIGEYERCAFVTPGTGKLFSFLFIITTPSVGCAGQFKPVGGANPTIGALGTVEYVEEDKVEVLVNDKGATVELKNAIEELKKVRR
jgi:hypothetical protein